jgi:hypothetical protein
MHEFLECLCLIMFNYELWTNPQWSFGWLFVLFLWMGRWRAWVVCFSLVSCWRLALELPRSAFRVLELSSNLGLSVCLFTFIACWDFITQYVEMRFFYGDVLWLLTWLLWRCLFRCWCDDIIISLRCLRKLFMHVKLIEEVASKYFAWFVLFV